MATEKLALKSTLVDLTNVSLHDLGTCTEPSLLELIENLTAEAAAPTFQEGRLANNAANDAQC